MKRERSLSQRYQSALQKHLRPGMATHSAAARLLGDQATARGMQTLEFARMHDRAFSALKIPGKGNNERAQIFFNDAIASMLETRLPSHEGKTNLKQLEGALSRRTSELSATNQKLRQGIIERASAESSLEKQGEHYARLLSESLHTQQGLRKLTHTLITAQENERTGFSQTLREEILQTLLAIKVRLVSLKKDAKVKGRNLNEQISSTQRLVKSSATSIRRVAREFRNA